jgi:hypothetical protein
VAKLLEKSSGGVAVKSTDPSINVKGATVPNKEVLPVMERFPLTKTFPMRLVVPMRLVLPPTYKLPLIPTPPAITRAPDVKPYEGTVLPTVIAPPTVIALPTVTELPPIVRSFVVLIAMFTVELAKFDGPAARPFTEPPVKRLPVLAAVQVVPSGEV